MTSETKWIHLTRYYITDNTSENSCVCFSINTVLLFSANLQQFLSCGSLFWILGQGQLDKMVEVICPVGSELGEKEKNK